MRRHELSISVIVATIGSRPTLSDAIESLAVAARTARSPLSLELVLVSPVEDLPAPALGEAIRLVRCIAPARGVYDAYNAGVAASSGTFIGFLNDDDLLPPDTLQWVADALDERPEAELVSGCAEVVTVQDGQRVRSICDPRILRLQPDALLSRAPLLNARWYHRSVLPTPAFDSDLRIAGDRRLMLALARSKPTNVTVDECLYVYRSHDTSLTFSGQASARQLIEEMDILAAEVASQPRASRQPALQMHGRRTAQLARLALRGEVGPEGRARLTQATRTHPAWPISASRHRLIEIVRIASGRDPLDGGRRH